MSGKGPTEHVLPGGIGTFSICHVADASARTVVKPELVTCAPAGKPDPDSSGYARYAGAPFALWSESVSRESASASRGKILLCKLMCELLVYLVDSINYSV